MNSAQLIYRGKLRFSFDIPFLDTPSYPYTSHLYVSTCGSAHGPTRGSTRVSARVSASVSLRFLMRLFARIMGG